AHIETGQGGQGLEQTLEFRRMHATLLRLLAHVHLHQDLHPALALMGTPVELPRELLAVDGMDPVEELHGVPGLVGLERADEMPRYRSPESGDLLLRFLDAIFSEGPDPGRDGHPYPLDLHRLGHRDEKHVVRLSTGALAGASDALMHSLEVCANVLYQCLSGWPILARRATGCSPAAAGSAVRLGESRDGDQPPHLASAIRVEEIGAAARAKARVGDPVAADPRLPKLLLVD